MKTIYSMTHLGTRTWSRRSFIAAGVAACVSVSILRNVSAGSLSGPRLAGNVKIENFSADGKSTGITEVPRVTRTEAEWSAQLTPASFEVTRHADTERPYSGEYEKNHASGLYRCVCCDTALFDSATKFESGTGWPSFYQPISRLNVAEVTDSTLGMRRTAVSCGRCDAHLGHVFDDGPRPTGLRYCMNSVSLHFVARA
jgi:peptide-methionine (R)-S-oxide reductase